MEKILWRNDLMEKIVSIVDNNPNATFMLTRGEDVRVYTGVTSNHVRVMFEDDMIHGKDVDEYRIVLDFLPSVFNVKTKDTNQELFVAMNTMSTMYIDGKVHLQLIPAAMQIENEGESLCVTKWIVL
jgi:hypothetical protein